MKIKFTCFCLFLLLGTCSYAQTQLRPETIEAVIREMTLEEKALLVTGSGWGSMMGGSMTGSNETLVPGAAGTTNAIPRLGIPATVLSDGPAGVRINPRRRGSKETYYATGFPIGSLLSSTWDTELVQRMTAAMGNEALEYGVDVLLAPGMNIMRNPLCGRNFEYFSEDPLLSGKIAAAYVNGIQNNGVGTSIKHFAANNQETLRTENDARIGERALREIYLKGFEIAVRESDPWTVMSSYNRLNGVYTQESKDLLTRILRDDWGFRGIVMTDWTGLRDTPAQILAGNDLMEPGDESQQAQLVEAVRNGSLSEEALDICVRRILEFVVRTPRFNGYTYSDKPDLAAHAQVARETASEGMVLLKNKNHALPLKSKTRVALFGVRSYETVAGGTGSGNVNKAYIVSLDEGLAQAGASLSDDITEYYRKYIDFAHIQAANSGAGNNVLLGEKILPELELSRSYLDRKAGFSQVAVITIGRNAGEDADRTIGGDFKLSSIEQQLIADVCDAFHQKGKKVIVVLNIGGVIETASWKDYPDAILLAWQPGQEAGHAIADVLTGKVNPSGKLPVSFANTYMDYPSSKNFPYDYNPNAPDPTGGLGKGIKRVQKNVDYTNYEEGIWEGYRYFDTAGEDVSYPFGFGLSYTDFNYEKPTVNVSRDGTITATITISNIGETAGKEAVQVYVSAPQGGLVKPVRELKSFAKTRLLQPGESQTLSFKLTPYDLASFNEADSAWETPAGEYTLSFAASSRDIRCGKSFKMKNAQAWKTSLHACAPEKTMDSAPAIGR